jgi:hypothetical protein
MLSFLITGEKNPAYLFFLFNLCHFVLNLSSSDIGREELYVHKLYAIPNTKEALFYF